MTVAPPTQVLRAARAVQAILKARWEAEIAARELRRRMRVLEICAPLLCAALGLLLGWLIVGAR